jgi:D-threonine aldolase
MNFDYRLKDTSGVYSPALLFYKDLIRRNLIRALEIAGGPSRLRPHAKTHKTREIVRMALQAGVTKHKCATIAEAEMLASIGVPDVLLAYSLVGPNCGRMARLMKAYPECRFSVLADSPIAVKALAEAMLPNQRALEVLLDLDVGQHRSGLLPGNDAVMLYEHIARLPGLQPGGLHVYDGHNHQDDPLERQGAVFSLLAPVLALKARLEKKGLPVPRLVVGGTPTFPIYARLNEPGLECAPGTCLLHDNGYGSRYSDLSGFTPAAVLITRVISRPTPTRVTFDLGYKAIASDPPLAKRCLLLDFPPYEPVIHNEEHFTVETAAADRYSPGDVAYAIPWHICPTVALHKEALIVENGEVKESWNIVARDRVLTI